MDSDSTVLHHQQVQFIVSEKPPKPINTPESFIITNPYEHLDMPTHLVAPLTRKQRREQERKLIKITKI